MSCVECTSERAEEKEGGKVNRERDLTNHYRGYCSLWQLEAAASE